MRASIHVASRDRSTELALLLQSLRVQTWQDWDVVIVDGSKPNTIRNLHHISCLIRRLKLEGHGVHWATVNVPGVCYARQIAIDVDPWKENELIVRLDDDVILEPTYLERLYDGMKDYQIMSGLTPRADSPAVMRELKYVKPIINRLEVNDDGTITKWGDDCAHVYDENAILPATHFRSCAMYYRKLHDELGINYKLGLSAIGFREESFISLKAILAGWKIGVNTGAINWHLQTPSGGCRFPNYQQVIMRDDKKFQDWLKARFTEKGNFIKKYHEEFK